MAITEEQITWAYRMFLDREPETEQVVRSDLAAIRKKFATSGEFKALTESPKLLISVHPPLMPPFGHDPREIFDLVNLDRYDAFCLEGGRPIRRVDGDIDFSNFFELLCPPK